MLFMFISEISQTSFTFDAISLDIGRGLFGNSIICWLVETPFVS